MNISTSFYRFLLQRKDESRIARLLHSCYYHEHYRTDENVYKLAVTNKDIDYLTFRNDGTISYLPAGKEHKVNDNGDWAREGRQSGRPSRVIRKILTPKAQKLFKDTDFELFANFYQASCDAEAKRFVIKPNKSIPDVYCEDREEGGASLNGSCMNGDSDYLCFYHFFDVDILCMYNNEGLLSGRALLWRLPDGRTFMDRVYVSKDHYYEMFIDYAREQDKWFWKKYYKTYDYKQEFMDKNREWRESISIKTKGGRDTDCSDYYPYIDTFQFGDEYDINNYGGSYTYNDTGGGRQGDIVHRECACCGREYDEDDMYYVDRGTHRHDYVCHDHVLYINSNTWTTDDIDGEIVEVNGDYYEKDDSDICYIESSNEWVMSDDAVYCDRDNQYYLLEDCVEDYEGEWILKTEAYEVNGEYYHESIVNKVA